MLVWVIRRRIFRYGDDARSREDSQRTIMHRNELYYLPGIEERKHAEHVTNNYSGFHDSIASLHDATKRPRYKFNIMNDAFVAALHGKRKAAERAEYFPAEISNYITLGGHTRSIRKAQSASAVKHTRPYERVIRIR